MNPCYIRLSENETTRKTQINTLIEHCKKLGLAEGIKGGLATYFIVSEDSYWTNTTVSCLEDFNERSFKNFVKYARWQENKRRSFVGTDVKVSIRGEEIELVPQSSGYKLDMTSLLDSELHSEVIDKICHKLRTHYLKQALYGEPYLYIDNKNGVYYGRWTREFNDHGFKEVTWKEYLATETQELYPVLKSFGFNVIEESQSQHEEKELAALPKVEEESLPIAPANMLWDHDFGYKTKLI